MRPTKRTFNDPIIAMMNEEIDRLQAELTALRRKRMCLVKTLKQAERRRTDPEYRTREAARKTARYWNNPKVREDCIMAKRRWRAREKQPAPL